MATSFGVPGIDVLVLAQKLADQDDFILLDVREPVELMYADLGDGVTAVPLSELARRRLDALPTSIANDKNAEVVVMCHHGNRSAQVTAWLRQNGWTNVYNLEGGIDAYAILVDSSVGRY